jgi:predicted TIM-barrel fold metal-dependent hydrolase
MIQGNFVLDAVTHAYNHTPENWADQDGGHSMVEMAYALAQNSPDPRYELSKEVYLSNWSVDDLANLLFKESQTDVAVFHPLAISSFKDGYVSLEKAAEALEKYPDRFIGAYCVVDPLTGPNALQSMAEQKDMFGDKALGLKLYPTSWQGHKPVSWRMDDPTLIYPLYEKAQQLGLGTVAVHKAVPIGPIPVGDAYNPSDLENAATDFPDLNFEIVHGGLAFLEETAWLLARFGNISVNMEIQNVIVERRPNSFADILLGLCKIAGNSVLDRLFWGSGGTLVHPQPGLEAFMKFQFPEEKLDNAGLFAVIHQITDENKRNMLGGTYARLHDLDLDAMGKAIEGDQFSRGENDPLPEPYSTISLADQVEKDREAAHA